MLARQGWIQGWKTDGVIIDASMLRGRLREASPREQGSGGAAPGKFLEFIKHANYPEKQSGAPGNILEFIKHANYPEKQSGAPGNFLEFIKHANYPEKQSGTSWQKIKPYFYGLLYITSLVV